MFEPEDTSVPTEETEPDKILILRVLKSASTTPSNTIEPDVPELSGAKYIVVVLSTVEDTTSTFSAVSNELFPKPLGTDEACNVNVSVSGSNPVIVTSPSIATGEPSINFTS